ncbi:hypothetical protein GCM10010191_10630 [Actinomadura vinacea]|uniref:DUF4253 domain-containing protein n=1 Tax=Actinomadura vinacea TaxID=115336 RepID=A0ABN3IJ96_9ACTN
MPAIQVPDGLQGCLITPDPERARTDEPVTEPVLWISDALLDDQEAGRLWADLLPRHRETGLWPLLLGNEGDQGTPWHTGDLAPVPSSWADEVDVDASLVQGWKLVFENDVLDLPSPFDAWPGRAPGGGPGPDPDRRAVELATSPSGIRDLLTATAHSPFLGLVPARDGAEAIIASGWSSEAGAEHATAILRTWQERFGVRLCSIGPDALNVTVAWPPRTPEHARHVAAEHYAFCPDLWQDNHFEEYAAQLVDAPVWCFWWD